MSRPTYPVFMMLAAATSLPILFFAGANQGPVGDLPFTILNRALGTFMHGLALGAAVALVDRQRPEPARIWNLLGTSVLASIAIAVGSLLVLPGVILWIRWAHAPIITIRDGAQPWESLRRSNEIIRGAAWELFGLAAGFSFVMSATLYTLTRLASGGPAGSLSPAGFICLIVVEAALAPLIMLWLILLHGDRTSHFASPPGS